MTPRKIKLPIASAALAALLLILVFLLPKWDGHTQSQVGRFVRGQDPSSYMNPLANQTNPIILRKTATGWVGSDPNVESWDEATRIADGTVPDAVVVVYSPPVQIESGFLALTQRETIETLAVWPSPDNQAEKPQRLVALQHLAKNGFPPEIVQRLSEGNIYTSEPLYGGYIYNGIFLILSILLLWSLSWVILIPSWIQIARAQNRLSRGMCPFCCYPLKDLQSPKCPECGSVIRPEPRREEAAGY